MRPGLTWKFQRGFVINPSFSFKNETMKPSSGLLFLVNQASNINPTNSSAANTDMTCYDVFLNYSRSLVSSVFL